MMLASMRAMAPLLLRDLVDKIEREGAAPLAAHVAGAVPADLTPNEWGALGEFFARLSESCTVRALPAVAEESAECCP